MLELDTRTTDRLRELCAQQGVLSLELFGSATTPHFDADRSDIDFLVEFLPDDPDAAADRYFGLRAGLEALFGRSVDLVMKDAIRNRFFAASVDATRKPLYAA